MKTWLLKELTGLNALELADIPTPVPGPGEVLLKVHYAGLNPADRYLAEKQYPVKPALPHILGRDGIGEVQAVGPGVLDMAPGMIKVIMRGDTGGSRPGTFAEQVAVPAEDLVAVPPGWTEQESAGATLVYLTAYQALTMWGALRPDSVILVTGASGGVGVATVQLAKAMGHTVVALSRSAEKSRRLAGLGARFTFNPEDPNWRRQLKAELATRRVDLAVDNIGGPLFSQVIDTLGDNGKVSVVGRLAGPVPEFNTATLFFRRIRIGGVAVGTYSRPEAKSAWNEVLRLLQASGAKPIVDSIFPFERLLDAFNRLASGPMGKVLLDVRQ